MFRLVVDIEKNGPMWSQSAPFSIIRLHSADNWPKSEASTEGEMIARGIAYRYT
jgi:hypothetical protein